MSRDFLGNNFYKSNRGVDLIFLRKKIILSMYINNSSVFIIYHYPVYLYAFTLYTGQDRVFQYQGLEKKLNFSEGDLIQIQEQYFLVL